MSRAYGISRRVRAVGYHPPAMADTTGRASPTAQAHGRPAGERPTWFARVSAALSDTPPGLEVDAAGEREWQESTEAWGRQVGAALFLVLGGANLLWWPTDPYVFAADPRLRAIYAAHRPWVSLLAFGVALVGRVPFLRRHVTTAIPLAAGVLLAYVLHGFAEVGPPSTPWFHLSYTLIVPSVGIPARLGKRVWLVAWLLAAMLVGYFGFHPEFWSDPNARLCVSYLLFVAATCIGFGHAVHRLRRDAFFTRRIADRRTAALDELNATLAERVAAQTAELRSLISHTESAREEERTRISRELHDELGQELTALRFALKVTEQRFARDPGSVGHNLAQLSELLGQTMAVTKGIVRDLRPRILDDLSLAAAAEWLVKRTSERSGLPCTLRVLGEPGELPHAVSVAAFRILQEALTNVSRHAQATKCEATLTFDGKSVVVTVEDDGVGLAEGRRDRGAPGGMGLVGMRERARSAGGELSVGPAPGRGTIVRAWLPFSPATTLPA